MNNEVIEAALEKLQRDLINKPLNTFSVGVKILRVTKDLLKQMPWVTSIEPLLSGDPVGYVRNVFSNGHTNVMIILWQKDYYLCDMDWQKSISSISRKAVRPDIVTRYFNSEEECNAYWDHYQKCKLLSEANHLYV